MNYQNIEQNEYFRNIPLQFNEVLSPIQKYKRYGIFPTQLFFHILLALFSSLQILLIINKTTDYARSQEKLFYNYFMSDAPNDDGSVNRILHYFTIDDLRSSVKNSVTNYFSITSDTVNRLEFRNGIANAEVEFTYFNSSNIDLTSFKKTENEGRPTLQLSEDRGSSSAYNITNPDELGILGEDNDILRNLLSRVNSFKIVYNLRSFIPHFYTKKPECFNWEISHIFTKERFVEYTSHLFIERKVCMDYTSNTSFIETFSSHLMWIHLLVLFFSIYSLIVTSSYVSKLALMFMKSKQDYENQRKMLDKSYSRSEESEYYNPLLSYSDHPINHIPNQFLHKDSYNSFPSTQLDAKSDSDYDYQDTHLNLGWSFICISSCILLLIGSLVCIANSFKIHRRTEMIIGMGCMLSYLNLGRYLQYSKDYSSIYKTVNYAMPIVGRFVFGVGMMLGGFILMAICIFWKSENFSSPSSTFITLFAISQGDSILDIFRECQFAEIIGLIFNYIYSIIFIIVVMNIFIAIIEEAFASSSSNQKKISKRTFWNYQSFKINNPQVGVSRFELTSKYQDAIKKVRSDPLI